MSGETSQKQLQDWQFLKQQNVMMKNKLTLPDLTLDGFANNDQKSKYFTGIDYKTLCFITNDIQQYVPQHFNVSLDPFSQILLTLMKLRLNLDFTDLSYRFGISVSTASNYFSSTIDIPIIDYLARS